MVKPCMGKRIPSKKDLFLQNGPLRVINGAIISINQIATPISQFLRPFIEVITPLTRGPTW